MRNILRGLKIFKIAVFVSMVMFLGIAFDSKVAFAADETGVITKDKCEKYGGRWDGKGFGTAWGVGCIFERDRGSQLGIMSSFSDMILRVDYYYPKVSVCHPSYDKKSGDGGFVVCNRKKDADKNIEKDKINQNQCSELGGDWWMVGTNGKTDYCKIYVVSSDYSDSREIDIKNLNDLPDYYRITSGDKFKSCRSGYALQEKEISVSGRVQKRKFCMRKTKLDASGNPTGSVDSSGETDASGSTNGGTSCAIDNIGWIVCPTTNWVAGIVTSLYTFVADNFLEIKSGDLFSVEGDKNDAYKVWGNFRNLANILFVILFIIVILSQITNIGISNYGIKKILPRLIIFAILINVSFWVSALFVDLSNIIGKWIFNTIVGMEQGWTPDTNFITDIISTGLGGGIVGVAAGFFGGTILLALALAFLGMAITAMILVARQAMVILLVIVSPIAFASAILPNTDGFFDKWRKGLKAMLMIYPICSAVVASMILASDVLVATAEGNMLLQILYKLLPMIGMISIVAIIKGALAMIDKLTGANISGAISGLNKNMQDGAKNSRAIKKMDAGLDKGIRRAANGLGGAINKASGGKIRLPRIRAMSRANERNIAAINKEDKEIAEGLALTNAEILRGKYGSQDDINVAVGDSLVSAIKTGNKKDINEATLTATASNMSPADIAIYMRRGLIATTDGEKKKQAAIAIMAQFGDKLKELSPSTHAFVKEVSEKAVGETRGYDEVKNDFDTWRNVGAEMANFRGDEAERFNEALYDMQSRGDISSANTIGNVAKKMLEDPNAKWSAGQISNLNRFAKYAESPSKSVDRPAYDDQSQKKSNQESSTTNQGRSMFIDNINYGESFIVPKNDNKQAPQPRGPRRWR